MYDRQRMEWTGSIRWIHNPVQSRRIWIGLDREMYIVYPISRDLRQFFLIVTLILEVLPSNLQLYTLVCTYM